MSAEATKPLTTDAGVVEATPAPAEALTADKVDAPAVEAPKVEEPASVEGEAAAAAPAAPAEEKKEEEEVEEPIHSGALGYKAPGLKNAFRFSKKYFWFGEEPVPVQSLSHYLRGEKAEIAHPAAAWSSQTGKGLLYFVKHADEKATPAGVLNLSEATDLTKDGNVVFHFKLHGHKHAFEAQTTKERNGWFAAAEKAIEEAKAAKENIVSSEGYKEELAKIGKPAALAATAANAGSTPKKSIDATPKLSEAEAAAPAAPAAESSAAPARAGSSSSSSSSDEEKKKKKKAKSKSRSVSRGKRASIFGGLLGKKDKVEEKAEDKKEKAEEKAEDKKEGETAAAAPAEASTAVSATAPVIPPVEGTTAAEETKVEETAAAPVAPVAEEKKVEEKPKPAKRGSIFGNFVEKLKSPTHEKKEADILPPPPAKDTETAASAPATEETPAAPVVPSTETTIEAPKAEETKPAATTPHKEKQHFSFGKFLGGAKEKVRSPSGEKAPEVPKTEEPAKVEEATPAVAAEPATSAAAVEPAAEAPKEETPAAAPEAKPKRASIFGSLLRNASKAGKPKKEKEAAATPAKVEEAAELKEETAAEPAKVEEKKEETPAAPAVVEPVTAADVVPEAAPVGQAPKSTPQVPATA